VNKKLLGIGIALVIVGVVLVVATVYQEQVAPPTEQPHMQPQAPAKYEWHSRNMVATVLGIIFIALALGFITIGLKQK